MKESAWKDRPRKQRVLLEGISPGKTTQIRGLMSITFSSHHFSWSHSFSAVAGFLHFSEASIAR